MDRVLDLVPVRAERRRSTAGYLSGGYRFGNIAPYVTYARVDANTATHIDGLPTAGLPPQAGAHVDAQQSSNRRCTAGGASAPTPGSGGETDVAWPGPAV